MKKNIEKINTYFVEIQNITNKILEETESLPIQKSIELENTINHFYQTIENYRVLTNYYISK